MDDFLFHFAPVLAQLLILLVFGIFLYYMIEIFPREPMPDNLRGYDAEELLLRLNERTLLNLYNSYGFQEAPRPINKAMKLYWERKRNVDRSRALASAELELRGDDA